MAISASESESDSASNPVRHWPDYRAVWRWHFYAGIFCLPFIVLLSVTGGLYLFRPQLEAWFDQPYDQLQLTGKSASVADQVRAAVKAVPESSFSFYELPDGSQSAARVVVRLQAGAIRTYIHPESLTVLQQFPESARLMRFLFRLHGELLLGDRGSNLVELAASWTVVLLITGLFLWWPRQSKGWGGILYPRLGAGSRLFWRDLHGVTGIWISTLVLLLLMSGLPWAKFWGDYFKRVRGWTGTAVASQDWANSSRAKSQGDLPSGREEPVAGREQNRNEVASGEHAGHDRSGGSGRARRTTGPPLPTDLDEIELVAATARGLHLLHPVQISAPSGKKHVWTVKSMTSNRPYRETVQIDGRTGEIVKRDGFAQRHWIDKVVAVGIAAHEGQLFGWPNQLLGLVATLGLLLMSLSGAVLWWRRRDRGLGAPAPGIAPRFSVLLLLIVVVLGLCLPLFGLSFLLVLIGEYLILRRIPGVSNWLGLRSVIVAPGKASAVSLLLAMGLLLLGGCESNEVVTGGTSGTLTAGGETLTEIQVTVYQKMGSVWEKRGTGVIDSSGKFMLHTPEADAPLTLEAGQYRFTLESAGAPVIIPKPYRSVDSTPLEVAWTTDQSELKLNIADKFALQR